tara:strand:+ start:543 stop:860 length:318 start_codon:yes stop_codon:yes gene_type:complete
MARKITPEKFIEVWQISGSLSEVAQKLNMKKSAVSVRAATYRRKGIPLKKYDRGGTALDIPTLADYARSLEEQDNAAETREPKLSERVRPRSFRPEGQEGEGSSE